MARTIYGHKVIDVDKMMIGLYGEEGKEMVRKSHEEMVNRERHEFDGTEYEGMTWREVQWRKEIAAYEKDRAERQQVVDNFPGTYADPMINVETGMIDLRKFFVKMCEENRAYLAEQGMTYWDTAAPYLKFQV